MDQRQKPHRSTNGIGYPRVYRVRPWQKIPYLMVLAALGVGGAALGIWAYVTWATLQNDESWFVPIIFSVVLMLVGAIGAVFILQYRLILDADRVEVAGFLYRRSMRRADVAGWRAMRVIVHFVTLPYLTLVPKDERARKLKILYIFDTDPVLEGWLASLPDLDRLQHAKAVREILQNPEFGETEKIRATRLASAGRIASVLSGGGAIFAVGMMTVLPSLAAEYYWRMVGVLAALPFLAVAMVVASKGLYCIDGEDVRNTARPNLVGLFSLPPIALALRAWTDVDVLDWQRALEIAAVVGVGMGLVSLAARSKARSSLALLFLFSIVWGAGAVVYYNVYFDEATPTTFPVRVTAKHISGGKSKEYRLTLEPWGPRTEMQDVTVTSDFYETVAAGQRVCVYLYPGALDMRWFEVNRCQSQSILNGAADDPAHSLAKSHYRFTSAPLLAGQERDDIVPAERLGQL
jgi:hypothetical protein